MNKFVGLLVLVLVASVAYAQYQNSHAGDLARRVGYLETHVQQLHDAVNGLRDQINDLYDAQYHRPAVVPAAPAKKSFVCRYLDIFKTGYIGRGNTKTEAMNDAQKECKKHSLTCNLEGCEEY